MLNERVTPLLPKESKFSITITRSRYQFCFWVLFGIVVFLVALFQASLIARTEFNLLALSILATYLVFVGMVNSSKHKPLSLNSFILTTNGMVSFANEEEGYQLLSNSRISFLGCWLMLANQNKVRKVFIFRDSLREQDYSRLSNVLKNLN